MIVVQVTFHGDRAVLDDLRVRLLGLLRIVVVSRALLILLSCASGFPVVVVVVVVVAAAVTPDFVLLKHIHMGWRDDRRLSERLATTVQDADDLLRTAVVLLLFLGPSHTTLAVHVSTAEDSWILGLFFAETTEILLVVGHVLNVIGFEPVDEFLNVGGHYKLVSGGLREGHGGSRFVTS